MLDAQHPIDRCDTETKCEYENGAAIEWQNVRRKWMGWIGAFLSLFGYLRESVAFTRCQWCILFVLCQFNSKTNKHISAHFIIESKVASAFYDLENKRREREREKICRTNWRTRSFNIVLNGFSVVCRLSVILTLERIITVDSSFFFTCLPILFGTLLFINLTAQACNESHLHFCCRLSFKWWEIKSHYCICFGRAFKRNEQWGKC